MGELMDKDKSQLMIQEPGVLTAEAKRNELERKAKDLEALELEFSKALDVSYEELEAVVLHRDTINNPAALSQVVINEVWNKVGEQLGLELTNETLIQEYIRKNPQDNPLAKPYSKEIGDKVLQDPRYKQRGRDAKAAYKEGTLKDEYTGKTLTERDKPNIDHNISREELYNDPRRLQSGETVAEAANDPSNLVVTNENLNKSKGKKSVRKYTDTEAMAQRKKQVKENYDKKVAEINSNPKLSDAEKKAQIAEAKRKADNILDADEKLMQEKDKEARREKNRRQGKKIALKTAKKAGIDAIKAVLTSVVADFLKKMMHTLINFFKEAGKSFSKLMVDLNAALVDFTLEVTENVKKYLKIAKDTVVGTIVSEAFAPVLMTFKKAASFVKQGVKFVREVFDYYMEAENRAKPFKEQMSDIGKIMVGILSVTGGILLSEVIEKGLLTIPILAVPIPLLGTLASFIATLVSSIVFGVIGAISVFYINKLVEKKAKTKLTKEVLSKQDEVLTLQAQQQAVLTDKMENRKDLMYHNISERHSRMHGLVIESLEKVQQAHVIMKGHHEDNRKTLEALDQALDDLFN